MKILKTILMNEIKDAIGHQPSPACYKSCLEYLGGSLSGKSYLANVGLAIIDWRHDTLIKCDECGDYFMPNDIWEDIDGYKFCSDTCVKDWKEKQEF